MRKGMLDAHERVAFRFHLLILELDFAVICVLGLLDEEWSVMGDWIPNGMGVSVTQ